VPGRSGLYVTPDYSAWPFLSPPPSSHVAGLDVGGGRVEGGFGSASGVMVLCFWVELSRYGCVWVGSSVWVVDLSLVKSLACQER